MKNNLETLLQQNMNIRKALHAARISNQQLQKQNSQLKQSLQDQQNQYNACRQQYLQLQKKYQFNIHENNKVANSLANQIQQLKNLVEEKQRQMQDIQIKLIPNIDQDMLRVKLISEMQGPYQQNIDKKDRQIEKLKDKISNLERKLAISELSLETKTKQYDRQIQQIKSFYQSENEKLAKQVDNILLKNQGKNFDKQILKNRNKQVIELRLENQLKLQEIYQLEKAAAQYKDQRKQLLERISLNQAKNILNNEKYQHTNIQKLKDQKDRLTTQLNQKNDELRRLTKKINEMEKDSRKYEEQLKKEIYQLKQKHQTQRYQLKEQLRILREQYKNIRESRRNNNEDDIPEMKITIKKQQDHINTLERQIDRMNIFREQEKKQCERLKEVIKEKEHIIRQFNNNNHIWNNEQNHIPNNPTVPKRDQQIDVDYGNQAQLKKKIRSLQAKVEKLTQKLEYANRKIVELIKQKLIKDPHSKPNIYQGQSQFTNNLTNYDEGIQLQYRDTGLFPLCPPVIYRPYIRYP